MPDYIKLLNLEGHVEGGYFGLFYKSSDKITPLSERYKNLGEDNNSEDVQLIERNAGSSIYFLLEKEGFSAWHRLKSDEIWHYYDGGSPIDIHVINQNGQLKTYTLGNPGLVESASFQAIIKAGDWFAAEVRDKTSFGLVGCTVAPSFEYEDFELAQNYRDELLSLYPEIPTKLIDKFINPNTKKSDNNTHDHSISHVGNRLTVKDYTSKFELERHPEGGYFHETYSATDIVIPKHSRYKIKTTDAIHRKAATAIYYLLDKQDFSAWHCIKSDEIWHYYDGGSPIDIHVIDQNGQLKTHALGNPSLVENTSFQVVIKAGEWFAAEVRNKESFALVGCTVSPGFEYTDFTLAERNQLTKQYPEHSSIINRLCRISSNKLSEALAINSIGFYASNKKDELVNTVDNEKNYLEI
ncbi:cupin domain-containing protein [Legionella gresilensis]|uniref:cupin domain-containing protein n=1 Tax=Legionella gresilensis TaxID=91823 RepID=UPI001A9485EF|nr:cupin domain-containing protein [Legionella gresilensis]